jgi:hypothetical protein
MQLSIIEYPNIANLAHQTHMFPNNTMSSHMKHQYNDIISHTISSCIAYTHPIPHPLNYAPICGWNDHIHYSGLFPISRS